MRTPCVLLTSLCMAVAPLSARASVVVGPAEVSETDTRSAPPPTAVVAPDDAPMPRYAGRDDADPPAGEEQAPPAGSGAKATGPTEGPGTSGEPPEDAAAAAAEGRMTAEDATVPTRMRPLQRAGWWTVAGAAVLGTVAGVLSSLARAQEDRLNALAGEIDPETGRFPTYADVQDDYERALSKGRQYATGAQVVAGVAAAALVTGLVLMFVDARRQAKASRAQRARRRPDRRRIRGLSIRF
ncbi:MAG: hypothetical protein D6705_04180 [Deltaproteobacteria bacterium]|nr:MAG: hypothetical protein D6705_04180 [Deltaproteobacteria bacterium]